MTTMPQVEANSAMASAPEGFGEREFAAADEVRTL